MPKTRMTGLDVSAVVAEMRGCLGMRVANIYDVNSKLYLFKLAAPDRPKVFILVESGVRLHTTSYMREKSDTPNNFCIKLRKEIRTKRLEEVRQLGVDRMVDLCFGVGEAEVHLLLELYGMGNIIMTDGQYKIMHVLRQHAPEEAHQLKVGDTYDLEQNVREHCPMSMDRLVGMIGEAAADGTISVKQMLGSTTVYGNAVLTHCLARLELRMTAKVAALVQEHGSAVELAQMLLPCLEEADRMVVEMAGVVSKGFITLKRTKQVSQDQEPQMMYDEFLPFLYCQYEQTEHLNFGSFGAAIDTFFAEIESQRIAVQKAAQQAEAQAKVNKVKAAQAKQLQQLEAVAALNERKAMLIELNHSLVDSAIQVVQSYLAQGMSWEALWELIQDEASCGNPLAVLIKKVNFAENQIVLELDDPHEDSDNEEDPVLVELDISMGAFANARGKYISRKGADAKKEKTLLATEKGIKSAEAKAEAALRKDKITAHVTSIRKVYWFEKFFWFVSSDGYLVIAGHDAQQNEVVVKRHLEPNDVYVHADLHGAASCVVKNIGTGPIPPATMEQAGAMAICRSNAWTSKVVTSAYWVYPDQVSKTAPSGEYLTTGSFMVRGKKNYLPPSRLELGFGLLFSLDEGSLARHHGEWKAYALSDREHDEPEADAMAASELNTGDFNATTESQCCEEHEKDASHSKSEEESMRPQASVVECEGGCSDEGDQLSSGLELHEHAADVDESNGVPLTSSIDGKQPDAMDCDKQEGHDLVDDSKAASEDKYGDAVLSSVDPALRHQVMKEIEANEKPQQKREGSKRMSKKERQLRKKGMSTEEIAEFLANAAIEKEAEPTEKVEKEPIIKVVEPVRGKRGQKKKLKGKYADQDDDERAIRMELLGHKPTKSAGDAKPDSEVAVAEAELPEAADGEGSAEPIWSMEDRAGWIEEDGQWRRLTPAEKRAIRDKEALEVRMLLEEEGITTLSKEEADKLSAEQVRFLTAVPTPQDTIHFAMAVCAPYTALSKYKYKVKVTPGTQKRGKATKQAMSLFTGQSDCTGREREVVRAIPDQEAIAVMVSDSKVSAPGLEKAKRNAKQNAKGKKQK